MRKKESSKEYTLTDIVGKSGLEQTMDEELQGTKGKEIVYVDSVGNVIETEKKTDAVAGNDLYLTIDKNLQEATYQIIEEKLAGILVSRIQNIMNYDPASAGDSSKIIIPIDDVYHALFANEVIDTKTFFHRQMQKRQKKRWKLLSRKRKLLHCGSYVPTPGSSGCFLQITFQRNAGIYELYCRRSSDGPGRNPIFRCDRYKR